MSFTITGQRSKWIDTSPQPDQMPQLRQTLTDEEYMLNLQLREPAVRFVLRNFIIDPEKYQDYLNYPVLLIGAKAFPMGIELSQWGYPVTLLVRSQQEKTIVKKNITKQGGVIEHIAAYNYFVGVPSSRIIIWVDDDKKLPRSRVKEWLTYLRSRCQVLIFLVKSSKRTRKITAEIPNTNHLAEHAHYIFGITYH